MELADDVREAADRLGLTIEESDGGRLRLERHDWRVTLQVAELAGPDADPRDRDLVAWLLQGVRLGLDGRARPDESEPYEAPRFRRASVRRYEEAQSVHGDHLPFLVPRPTRRLFEEITDTRAFRRSWLLDDLEVLVVHETGIRMEVLTHRDQAEADLTEDKRWTKVRSALFYQSYKVRPTETIDVDGGQLRIIETREGFGATRAVLLPEFDYDASREYGYLAVPSRDRIVVARPQNEASAPRMLPALSEQVADSIRHCEFGLTDAIFELEPEDVGVHRRPTRPLDPQGRPAVEFVTDLTPP